MATAENGNKVKIHYKGTLNDGTEFDTSEGREPLKFTLGNGQVIPGFDKRVLGMTTNEKKTLNIPATEAYGAHRDDLVMTIPKTEIPSDIKPEVGMQLQMQGQEGQQFNVLISELTDENITLDANHPLAGQDLNFDVELVEIVE